MAHGVLQNPSLIIDLTLFGTTFGCINLAFFQWLRSTKKKDRRKEDRSNRGPVD
jgi:hypothetical protein